MKRLAVVIALLLLVVAVGCVTLNITVYFQPEQLDKAAEKSVERMWNLDGKPGEGAAPEAPAGTGK
ncbi:MAG: hypothetical protein RDV41_15100 [Planctomycetota bacterium]|nr:hypothetical protein [Planctomycetota bacterium]